MSHLRFTVKRFLVAIPTLFGVSVITFAMMHLAPGDPAQLLAGEYGSRGAVEDARRALHLNEPIYVQYLNWASDFLRGDFGLSWGIQPGRPNRELILGRLPVTFQLAGMAFILSVVIGIPAGIISAVYQDKLTDHFTRVAALTGVSIPNFWLGIIFIVVIGVQMDISWGVGGWVRPSEDLVESFLYLIFPAIALGTANAALIVRMMRSEMLDVLSEDYIKCARGMGVSKREVILKDATRNALVPIVTIVGLSLAGLLNGSVLIEVVFALPGLGALLIDSIYLQDFRLTQAIVMLIAVIYIAVNFVVDVTYAYLDPRIRDDS